MNKKNTILSFCGGFFVIVMFNVLQAGGKENTNPYSWTSPFKRIGHRQDIKKFGSKVMDKNAQKAIRQVLRNMGVENAEKVPLKKLKKKLAKRGGNHIYRYLDQFRFI